MSGPQLGNQNPGKLRQFFTNTLIVVVWIAVCALGVYYFGPTTSSYRPANVDLEGLRQELDRIKQGHVAAAEQSNREKIERLEKQTQLLRNVKTEADARAALGDVDLNVLISAWMERLLASRPRGDFPVSEKLAADPLKGSPLQASKTKEFDEAAKVLAAEVLKVAEKHPGVFQAVYEKRMPASLFLQPRKSIKTDPFRTPPSR
jgi:hypothetical protein